MEREKHTSFTVKAWPNKSVQFRGKKSFFFSVDYVLMRVCDLKKQGSFQRPAPWPLELLGGLEKVLIRDCMGCPGFMKCLRF